MIDREKAALGSLGFHPLEEVSEGGLVEYPYCGKDGFHPLEEVSEDARRYVSSSIRRLFPSLRGSFGSRDGLPDVQKTEGFPSLRGSFGSRRISSCAGWGLRFHPLEEVSEAHPAGVDEHLGLPFPSLRGSFGRKCRRTGGTGTVRVSIP